MYKRDLITAEIEKLAQVLARILGLRVELKLDEADNLFASTLANSFGLDVPVLYDTDLTSFKDWLIAQDLPADKLDMLTEFLFHQLDAQDEDGLNNVLAQKLMFIYETLAQKFHIVHLKHLDRQNIIKRYIS